MIDKKNWFNNFNTLCTLLIFIVTYIGDIGRVIGRDRVQLVPRDNGYPSRANFSGISITPGN